MNKYVCIHGHFYQPPRENPWLDEVELQDSAFPYHDWNERVTVESYGRNASARILNSHRKIEDIVNNYSKISFNFGPTLLIWMEKKSPEVYQAILEADQISRTNFSGHGSAMAQVFNHIIMPLANERDKRTQIIWGIRDFEHRFKRKPEGMWLAETAVDLKSLEIMAELGIKFTVLAPRQARRVRLVDQEEWKDVKDSVDPKVPYICPLPSGRHINIFFYDGPISQAVAFEGLLNNGQIFAERLMSGFNPQAANPQLVSIATDGETYGHHHKFGDMALAYCLQHIETQNQAKLTIYGEFLEKFPPTHEVEIYEDSSWSCFHGVERWRSNCGCSSGMHKGWDQEWRVPLREGLDWLRDQLSPLYEVQMQSLDVDPWSLRNDYIEVILNRNSDCVESFISRHVREDLPEEEKIRLLKLLEMQYNALLMYTSCGWFFDDIGGIEGVQIMKYAARAIQLAKEVSGQDFEEQFVQFLEKAQSNVPECKNGGHVYRTTVQPSVVDLLRVGAHYAVTSLYEEYPERVKMYAYTVQTDRYDLKAAGRLRLAIGKGWVRSDITFEKHFINFVVLHLGDHNFIGGVDYLKSEENFALMHRKILNAFLGSNILEVISLINQYFGTRNYSLWHLFKHEQQKILNMVLQSTMQEIESSFRQIYEHHYPLMQIKNEIQLPLPRTLTTVVEFVLNQDLFEALESEEINVERLQTLIEEIKRWSFKRDQANFNFIASQKISDMMVRFSHQPDNIGLMEKIELILKTLTHLNLELDLWKAQNIFFSIKKTMYAEKKVKSERDELARRWLVAFNNLAQFLQIAIR